MTTYFSAEKACAHCSQTSQQQVLGSTNRMGAPDLDLRPPGMERFSMDAWVQECPHCGYTAADLAEKSGDLSLVGSPDYQEILEDESFPRLARRFQARAWLHATSNPDIASLSFLHAAWVCDDEENGTGAESARECRHAAWECLAELQPFADTEDSLTQGAVGVDILRRAGEFEQAADLCNSLLGNPLIEGILRQVLEFQSTQIAAQSDAAFTVEDATSG